MQKIWISILIGYFIGSIPFCVLTAKLYRIDLSKIGSGNLGGTNLSRVIGWKIAIWPAILDGVKTFLAAIFITYVVSWDNTAVLLASTAAAFGHIYPWWNKFKGGKGVATMIGFSFVTLPFWISANILIIMFVIVYKVKIMTYASMFSITCILILNIFIHESTFYNFENIQTWPYALVLWLLIVWKHRNNILRITNKQERTC